MDAAVNPEQGAGFAVAFTRRFAAPRELVFKLWTDAEHLAQWWGPVGFTAPLCVFEARPGGRIHIDMRGPDGIIYPMYGTVTEIVPPERLVMRCTCCGDDKGNPGAVIVNRVTFHAEGGGTRLELEARVESVEDLARDAIAGMEQGWSESLARLTSALQLMQLNQGQENA